MLPTPNSLVSQLPGLVFYKNTDLVYTAASSYAARLCGFEDADQFCGHNDFELRCAAAESAEDFREEDAKVINKGEEISCLQVHQFADKNIHIFLLRKAPVLDAQGKIIGVCSMGNEIVNANIGEAIFKLISLGEPKLNNFKNTTFEINANEIFNKLSAREAELIFYFLRGFGNKEIGNFMSISHRTVESYLDSIKSKFHCNSRNELLLYCMHNGFNYVIPQSILLRCMNSSICWRKSTK